jgi:hypothetical protein
MLSILASRRIQQHFLEIGRCHILSHIQPLDVCNAVDLEQRIVGNAGRRDHSACRRNSTPIACLINNVHSAIVVHNLEKTTSRWLPTGEDDWVDFDEHFPPGEQLPRLFVTQFVATLKDGISKVEVFVEGERRGAKLNDNSYVSGGYRTIFCG